MLVTETIMDHLATSLGMDPFVLRTQNLYKVRTGKPETAWSTLSVRQSILYQIWEGKRMHVEILFFCG